MSVLLLFIDGVGVGRDDPEVNPFAAIDARYLGPLRGRDAAGGARFRPLDATLGVPGLPQSATGQTTLFTGVNAAQVAGAHMTGVPGPSLLPLFERSLFKRLVDAGRRPTFANPYTRSHLDARRPRWSASTRMVLSAGIPFRMIGDDDVSGTALYHDYTGEWLEERGIPAVRRSAAEAAAVLAHLLEDHDLVLYEYFLTDLAGHRGTDDDRLLQARRVEELVAAVVGTVDLANHAVLLVSDHGNLEDGTHNRHTTNPVPLLGWGARAPALVESIDAMTALTPSLSRG